MTSLKHLKDIITRCDSTKSIFRHCRTPFCPTRLDPVKFEVWNSPPLPLFAEKLGLDPPQIPPKFPPPWAQVGYSTRRQILDPTVFGFSNGKFASFCALEFHYVIICMKKKGWASVRPSRTYTDLKSFHLQSINILYLDERWSLRHA